MNVGKKYQISYSAGARPGVADNAFRVWWNGKKIGEDVVLNSTNDGNKLVWHYQDNYYIVAEKSDGNKLTIIDPL